MYCSFVVIIEHELGWNLQTEPQALGLTVQLPQPEQLIVAAVVAAKGGDVARVGAQGAAQVAVRTVDVAIAGAAVEAGSGVAASAAGRESAILGRRCVQLGSDGPQRSGMLSLMQQLLLQAGAAFRQPSLPWVELVFLGFRCVEPLYCCLARSCHNAHIATA